MSYQNKFTVLLFTFLLLGIWENAKAQKDLTVKLAQANSKIYSDPQKSIALASEVYRKAPKDSDLQLSSLIALGAAYGETFKIEKAIEALTGAQKIAELKNDYVNQVRILSFLGYQYQALQINEKTHTYLDRAEDIANRHALPDSLLYLRGNNYSIKALMYKETLDCNYAVEYFNKAITIYKKLKNNEVANTNLCIAYLQKSLCFIENKKPDSAKISLTESDHIIKKMKLTDDIEISQQLAWAKYYALNKKYSASNSILNNNLQKAKKMSQLGIEMDFYHLLAQNYLEINDVSKYKYYSNLYTETKKKFSEAEKNSITHIINKALEKTEANNYSFSGKKFYAITILLVVILGFTIYFITKSYRLKKKMKDFRSNQKL